MAENTQKFANSEAGNASTDGLPTSGREVGNLQIAERLEALRQSLGMEVTEFAGVMKVSSSTYYRYKTGETSPRAAELSKLSALGANLNWLVSGEGTMRLTDPPDSLHNADFVEEAGNPQIGIRIEKLRTHAGLSQVDLAARLGVTIGTYHRYRRGLSSLTHAGLGVIADMGYSLDWLITGEGSMRRGEPPESRPNPTSPAQASMPTPEIDASLLGHVILQLVEGAQYHGLQLDPRMLAGNAAVYYKRLHGRSAAELEAIVNQMVAEGKAEWK